MQADNPEAYDQVPPEVLEADAQAEAAVQQQVGGDAPVSEQPFAPESVPMLANAVNTALNVLSNGQIPEIGEVPAEEGLVQVPPEIFTAVAATYGGLMEADQAGVPGAAEYAAAIDPAQLGSDEGIRAVIAGLGEMEMDKKFIQGIHNTPAPGASPEAPAADTTTTTTPAAPEDDLEGLV